MNVFVSMGLAMVIASAAVSSPPTHPLPTRYAIPSLASVDVGVPITSLAEESWYCSWCVWHQYCGPTEHTLDKFTDTVAIGYNGDHSSCAQNSGDGWCYDHSVCRHTSARVDSTIKTLVAQALDGGQAAMAELVQTYPLYVSFNKTWDVIEVRRCPTSTTYTPLPAENFPSVLEALAK